MMKFSPAKKKQTWAAIASILLLVLLDQWTKILAARHLIDGPYVLIPGVFEFRYLENRGMAFSLLQNRRVLFLVGTAVFLVFMVYLWKKMPETRRYRLLRILAVFITAGAIGNLIDRAYLGYVRDFLYISLIDFPIFNVADMYVTISAAALLLAVIFVYSEKEVDVFFSKSPASEKEEEEEKENV